MTDSILQKGPGGLVGKVLLFSDRMTCDQYYELGGLGKGLIMC